MSELFSIQLQNQQQSRDGVWLDLPTTTEQVQAALRQIGISSDNPQGLFISGYFAEEEKRFAIPYNMVLASNVDELNFLASRLETLSTVERAELNAALLKDGKAKVKGLYSEKTGKTYDATVLLADTGGKYVNYQVERKE